MWVPFLVLAAMLLSVGPSERAITTDLKTGGTSATINTLHYRTLNYSAALYGTLYQNSVLYSSTILEQGGPLSFEQI